MVLQYVRTRPSAVLALAHAVFLGAFLGVLSNTASAQVAPGVFVHLVLGTMTSSAAVLAAHRLRWTRIARRARGLAGATGLGLRGGGLVILTGAVGVALGTSFLTLHLGRVESALARGLPREERWLAASGLTLTLVWLYVEAVRLLTLVPQEDVLY
ncbi:Bax inhibitor-1/YccA family protein [Streptomyces sp. NPDC057197]|uniref:Bax inhibitor-1/YccA family membrane protein n=1 Tax=Streptomyces sp. NPDC057197 TaxID=3346045 RepID=UPI003633580F